MLLRQSRLGVWQFGEAAVWMVRYITAMQVFIQNRQIPTRIGLSRAVVTYVATVLVCHWLTGAAVAQISTQRRIDEIEGQFLTELLDRQLFELAEEYCLDRLDQRQNAESLAYWTDRLCTAYRQHTWLESGPNRTALTQTAVKTITTFLSIHVASPEAELTLRLNQVELLLNLIQIDFYLTRVGHRGPRDKYQFPHLQALNTRIERATQLVESLDEQMNRVGRQLARDPVSRLRERARRITAELEVVRVVLNEQNPTDAMKQLYRLERSARTDSTRWVALTLQAELQLAAGDFERNDLTLRRIDDQFPERSDEVSQLRVRALIRKGQPTEALRLIDSIHPLNVAVRGASRDVLRLESMLQLRVLAGQLQDAELILNTDDRFNRVAERSRAWPPSVQRDAVQSLIATYGLVRTVGAEIAHLVEHVEMLQAAGMQDDAIRELQRALRILRPDASLRSRGAIYLALGELHVSQESWDDAIGSLKLATEHLGQAKLTDSASRADLLRSFCIGQQWRRTPSDTAAHAAYVDALTHHRSQWKDQKSWVTATDWLIQVYQQTEPLLACELLQQAVARAEDSGQQVSLLIRWGTLLDNQREESPNRQTTKRWRTQVASFQGACEAAAYDKKSSNAGVLKLIQMAIGTDAQTPWEQWTTIAAELPEIRRQLTAPGAETQARLSELQLVASSRTSTDVGLHEQIQTVFIQQHSTDPLGAAQRISRFLTRTGLILPGDSFLAETIEMLIRQQVELTATSVELIPMFSLSCLTAGMTRDHQLQDQLLDLILEENLTAAQVKSVASILASSNVKPVGDSIDELMRLWQRIRNVSVEGSEMWLESSLQLADMLSKSGQHDQAAQRIRVISVLYPEWGSAERLSRVQKLLTRSQPGSKVD